MHADGRVPTQFGPEELHRLTDRLRALRAEFSPELRKIFPHVGLAPIVQTRLAGKETSLLAHRVAAGSHEPPHEGSYKPANVLTFYRATGTPRVPIELGHCFLSFIWEEY